MDIDVSWLTKEWVSNLFRTKFELQISDTRKLNPNNELYIYSMSKFPLSNDINYLAVVERYLEQANSELSIQDKIGVGVKWKFIEPMTITAHHLQYIFDTYNILHITLYSELSSAYMVTIYINFDNPNLYIDNVRWIHVEFDLIQDLVKGG